jgi:hypothetical protein
MPLVRFERTYFACTNYQNFASKKLLNKANCLGLGSIEILSRLLVENKALWGCNVTAISRKASEFHGCP